MNRLHNVCVNIISSFILALAMKEVKGWKPFHNALQGRSDTERSLRDTFFDIPQFYLLLLYPAYTTLSTTYFNSAVYCFRQLVEYAKQVEQMMAEIWNWKEGDLS